mmetsp:Transcript_113651/g.270665  ORF Transcript_113651/g.270665 Transcript_113651/m.270665 type:complete len:278 (+) Transcript_113651:225-1058(+)
MSGTVQSSVAGGLVRTWAVTRFGPITRAGRLALHLLRSGMSRMTAISTPASPSLPCVRHRRLLLKESLAPLRRGAVRGRQRKGRLSKNPKGRDGLKRKSPPPPDHGFNLGMSVARRKARSHPKRSRALQQLPATRMPTSLTHITVDGKNGKSVLGGRSSRRRRRRSVAVRRPLHLHGAESRQRGVTNDEKIGQRGLMIVVKIVGKIVGKIVAKIVARIVVMSDAMSDATSVGMIAVTIDGRIVGTIEEMTAGKPGGMSPVIGVRRHRRDRWADRFRR